MLNIKICPKCKSKNIELIMNSGYYGAPQKVVCKDCGFESYIYLEKEKKRI